MESLARTLTGMAVAITGVTAMTLGFAGPALAAGNNVVNAHCGAIVLDLKDNPLEHDSRGQVTVTVNGRTVYAGPVDTADFHRVIDGLGTVDAGYEWTVTITHPYTGEELHRSAGAVQCQTAPRTPPTAEVPNEKPTGPVEVEVPLPPDPKPQAPLPNSTTYVVDVPMPELPAPVMPAPTTTHVVDVPLPTVIEPPAVVAPPLAVTPGQPSAPEAPDAHGVTQVIDTPDQPDADIGSPTTATSASISDTDEPKVTVTTATATPSDTTASAALPNLGGPDLALAGLAGALIATGGGLVLVAHRRDAS
jgi:hypothetical protein